MLVDELGALRRFRVLPSSSAPRVRADELDERRDPERPADVMDVEHEYHHAEHDQHVRDNDRQSWHRRSISEANFAEREHRVHEGGDEESHRDLARLVTDERLHDSGRELTHRELHDHHRDRQDQCGQRHHRRCDRGQDLEGGVWSAGQRARYQVEVGCAVGRDGQEGERGAQEHAHHRDKPEARRDLLDNATTSHLVALPARPRTDTRGAGRACERRRLWAIRGPGADPRASTVTRAHDIDDTAVLPPVRAVDSISARPVRHWPRIAAPSSDRHVGVSPSCLARTVHSVLRQVQRCALE